MACCSSSDKYRRICGGLWCLLQRCDLMSGGLTADRLYRNATPREHKSDPRMVAAAARKQIYSEFPVCPERCQAREGPQNAAERSWWCSLCDTTPAPQTVHCHGLPSRICQPSTCHLVKSEHSPLPTDFAFAGGRRA